MAVSASYVNEFYPTVIKATMKPYKSQMINCKNAENAKISCLLC
jgi:hypothetical protein